MLHITSMFVLKVAILFFLIQRAFTAPTSTSNQNIKNQALKQHNKYRKKHHAVPVVWSSKLAKHAKKVTDSCVWGHNVMSGTGQNIAYGYSSMTAAVDGFYKEVANYNYKTGKSSNGKVIGHFTQVVWNSTTEIGCAATYCSNLRTTYYVCDYSPPGNYIGRYTKNVFAP
ncbi:MAG: CAP domain-containing protein [Benjaminiella poitrasii]|nr:MAG: CAP domain-containing protein [Benjaminiella poitrasii]